MFESTHPQAAIKVIDFGLSKNYSTSHSHHILTERVGTLYSMSPETMRGIAYTSQADLWSIGVVAYILLANGRMQPFEGKNPKQLVANVLRGRFSFDDKEIWEPISPSAQDFVSKLLVLEPDRRLTASTAREHRWFNYCKKLQEWQQSKQREASTLDSAGAAPAASSGDSIAPAAFMANTNNEDGSSSQHGADSAETSFRSTESVDASQREELKNRICRSLVEYADMSEFRKLALNVIAKKASSNEIFELRKVFQEFDYLGTGTITLEEFSTALSQLQYSPHAIHKIFSKIDVNRDNAINYTEFLAAALETQGTIEEYRLAEAFDLIDDEDSGYISHENLRKILPRSKYCRR
jgi:calcium-dependent protein kinase